MSRVDPVGVVAIGVYEGENIYIRDKDALQIVDGVFHDGFFSSAPNELMEISKKTVSKYEDVSSSKTGPNGRAALVGTLLAGPIFGALNAMASSKETHDVALYFMNGTKCIIHLIEPKAYELLKRILFVL